VLIQVETSNKLGNDKRRSRGKFKIPFCALISASTDVRFGYKVLVVVNAGGITVDNEAGHLGQSPFVVLVQNFVSSREVI